MINSDDLRKLREIFRARMRVEDFCVGEECVERLFRELLGEPEPARDIPTLTPEQVRQAKEELDKWLKKMGARVQKLFERDDAFFRRMMKK